MDRVLVEVLITTSILCLSAVITTSCSQYYLKINEAAEELSAEKALYSLAAAIKETVATSVMTGKNVSTLISFQAPLSVQTEGELLILRIKNSVNSIFLGVEVRGGGVGRAFRIEASQNLVTLSSTSS